MPGMADMPGESQEEPSVIVVAMLRLIQITSTLEMSFQPVNVASVLLVTQHRPISTNGPSNLLLKNQGVEVLLGRGFLRNPR